MAGLVGDTSFFVLDIYIYIYIFFFLPRGVISRNSRKQQCRGQCQCFLYCIVDGGEHDVCDACASEDVSALLQKFGLCP